MTILDDLDFRGSIYQVTDREGLAERLEKGPVTVYAGFDPTADSLTVGNLAPLLQLRRFQLAGHRAIVLVGGGTGLIGDPGGKTEERALNPAEVVAQYSEKIRQQLEPFLDFEGDNAAHMVNNYDWLGSITAIDLFRDVGKHFTVPYMLAKESVASRLETGITFTEFSYMIMQSLDFLRLYETMDCEVQIGGSDQWGNITAGTDLIRRAVGGKAFGLTCPLITTSDGTKFGKTETGTGMWLSPERTSPYEFYQYWINTDDSDVVGYLKVFTFLSHEEILDLEKATASDPGKREAQRVLARKVTTIAHGADMARKAEKISHALFYGELGELAEDEIELGFDDVPTYTMTDAELGIVDLLVNAGVSSSKREARQDISNGAIYINGERSTELDRVVRKADGLHGKYVVVRRGKNRYFLVK